jgi:hypothetical protein
VGLHKGPHSPVLFVQVTNSYFRLLLSSEAIKWLGQGLDDWAANVTRGTATSLLLTGYRPALESGNQPTDQTADRCSKNASTSVGAGEAHRWSVTRTPHNHNGKCAGANGSPVLNVGFDMVIVRNSAKKRTMPVLCCLIKP